MINQGVNINDYQRTQPFMQSPLVQMPQRTKNLYSVVEVTDVEEVRKVRIEPNITYIFLNENSDKLFIRQA